MNRITLAVLVLAANTVFAQKNSLTPVWTQRQNLGANEFVTASATNGLLLYTTGMSGDVDCVDPQSTEPGCSMILTARLAATGTKIWSIALPGIGNSIALNGPFLLVGGSGYNAAAPTFQVWAFDSLTGRLLW